MIMSDTQSRTSGGYSSQDEKEHLYKMDNEPFIPAAINNFALQAKLPVSLAFKRTCYKCGNLGHHAEDCSSGERLCYNCKQPGHESSKCPNDRSSESKQCYFCKEIGHIQSECPKYKALKKKQMQELFHGTGPDGILYPTRHDFNLQGQNFDPYAYRLPPYQTSQGYRQDPSAYYQQQQNGYQPWMYNHSPTQQNHPLPLQSHPPHYDNYAAYIPGPNPNRIPVPYPFEHMSYPSQGPNSQRSFTQLNQYQQQQQPQQPANGQHPAQPYYIPQHQSQFDQYNNLIQLRSHSNDPSHALQAKSQIHCYTCGEPGHESKGCPNDPNKQR